MLAGRHVVQADLHGAGKGQRRHVHHAIGPWHEHQCDAKAQGHATDAAALHEYHANWDAWTIGRALTEPLVKPARVHGVPHRRAPCLVVDMSAQRAYPVWDLHRQRSTGGQACTSCQLCYHLEHLQHGSILYHVGHGAHFKYYQQRMEMIVVEVMSSAVTLNIPPAEKAKSIGARRSPQNLAPCRCPIVRNIMSPHATTWLCSFQAVTWNANVLCSIHHGRDCR